MGNDNIVELGEHAGRAMIVLRKFYEHATGEWCGLHDELAGYRERVREQARSNELVDIELADAIASGLQTLLTDHDLPLNIETRRWVESAVRYFIAELDGDFDFDSVVGFEDDAIVFNHIVTQVGREDLLVEW